MDAEVFSRFVTVVADGLVPDRALVDEIRSQVPAFVLPSLVRLSRATDLSEDERLQLGEHIIAGTADMNALYDIIGYPEADGTPFYPPEDVAPTPDTVSAIDTFIETYGHAADAREDALLERMIFNPTPDYATVLEQEYDAAAVSAHGVGGHDALIDAFLKRGEPVIAADRRDVNGEPVGGYSAEPDADAPQSSALGIQQPEEPALQPEPRDDSSLSESLAKIYIRQGKYDKAYEILSHLNLNIPTKNAYFADQLRFLKKLMVNSRYK